MEHHFFRAVLGYNSSGGNTIFRLSKAKVHEKRAQGRLALWHRTRLARLELMGMPVIQTRAARRAFRSAHRQRSLATAADLGSSPVSDLCCSQTGRHCRAVGRRCLSIKQTDPGLRLLAESSGLRAEILNKAPQSVLWEGGSFFPHWENFKVRL